jgi:hypothetical protein
LQHALASGLFAKIAELHVALAQFVPEAESMSVAVAQMATLKVSQVAKALQHSVFEVA